MKTRITLIGVVVCLIAATLNSCKKERMDTPLPEKGELHDVNFEVKVYTKEVIPMGSVMSANANKKSSLNTNAATDNAVDTYIQELDYFLYDSNGTLVNHTNQQNGVVIGEWVHYGFNHYELYAGDYKLIVIGSMGGLSFPDSTNYATAALVPGYVVEDIFYKELAFTVNEENNTEETITIERIVGSIEVKQREMVGELWGGAPQILAYSVSKYPFDKNQEHEVLDPIQLPQISGEVVPYKTSDFVSRGFVLPDRSGSFNRTVMMIIPGVRSGQVAFKDFNDIIVKPNFKVLITGTLTGDRGQQYFDVVADSTWAGTVTHEFEGE